MGPVKWESRGGDYVKCYCAETGSNFIFFVEDLEGVFEANILAAWYEKTGNNRYRKTYPNTICDKERLADNFPRLGPLMFQGGGDWVKALETFAKRCKEKDIEWYITGSVSEALIGVKINPHDIDIVCHTKDFFRLKDAFLDCLVEPFIDNQGTWIVRYFGRLCVNGVMIDVVADESRNAKNHEYTPIQWKGYAMLIEPLYRRYEIERERQRDDRVRAIDEYLTERKDVKGSQSIDS